MRVTIIHPLDLLCSIADYERLFKEQGLTGGAADRQRPLNVGSVRSSPLAWAGSAASSAPYEVLFLASRTRLPVDQVSCCVSLRADVPAHS